MGNHHLIYLKEGGSVWGKGSNYLGQLGQASLSNYPDPVEIVSDGAVDVATGSNYSMILMQNGKILTFGENWDGQLGTGENLAFQT